MFLLIYVSFLDAISFIRKTPKVLLPYTGLVIFGLVASAWFPVKTTPYQVIYFIADLLIVCSAETLLITHMYVKDELVNSPDSVWQISKRFYGNAVALFLVYFCISFLYNIPLELFNIELNYPLDLFLLAFLFYVIFGLGLRSSLLQGVHVDVRLSLIGFKHLGNHFIFYLFHFLTCFTIIAFSDLLLARLFNWAYIILSPGLYSLVSIALTYAFVEKSNGDHS